MAIVWILKWPDLTKEQYAELRAQTRWEEEPPAGLQHQVTAFSDKALILTQVWQSPDHVMRFMEDRLLPAVRAAGINNMPRVDQYPVHSIYNRDG